MDLSVELYVRAGGRCPAQEFMDDLKRTNPGDFAAMLVGWPARETTWLLSALAARRIADRLGAGRIFGAASPPPPDCLALRAFVSRLLRVVVDHPFAARQFERQAELVIA